MSEEKVLFDTDLGTILFRKNKQAKHYIIRLKTDKVVVTVPRLGTYKKALSFFNENRSNLLAKYNELKSRTPSPIDEVALRKQARAYLPNKLATLAQIHGFNYTSTRITKSKTRWGSCSSKGTINLSYFLMLLPDHLIEYVLLHELCHTIEMNHSINFWNLLNKHTNGNAKLLRKELKKHRYF